MVKTLKGGARRSKRGLRCWTRRTKRGSKYRVCNKSKGQKGVYRKKTSRRRRR